jgi:hypothetical protein
MAAPDYRQALEDIMHICENATNYSRKTQAIHNKAMAALGMTSTQREQRYLKAFDRCETFSKNTRLFGISKAKKIFEEDKEEIV